MYSKEIVKKVCARLRSGTPAETVAKDMGLSMNTVSYMAYQNKISISKIRKKIEAEKQRQNPPVPLLPERAKESLKRTLEIVDLARKEVPVEILCQRYKVTKEMLSIRIRKYNALFPEKRVKLQLNRQRVLDKRQQAADFSKTVYLLRQQGLSFPQIAERFACGQAKVQRVLYAYCKANRLNAPETRTVVQKSLSNDDVRALIEARKNGASLADLAVFYGISKGLVSRYCIEIGGIRSKRGTAKGNKRGWTIVEPINEPFNPKRRLLKSIDDTPKVDVSNIQINIQTVPVNKENVQPEVSEAELKLAFERYQQLRINRKRQKLAQKTEAV